MGTIDSKKLNAALTRAKNVGLLEERFTVEDCELVLRNLRPAEYVAVIEECQGLGDVAYLHAYQRGHLARAIVEINGVDLRSTEFVSIEDEDLKRPGQTKTVKLELHDYLLKHVLATWSQEAVFVAYRKFGDLIGTAERKAKEGVTFLTPDETAEDKYRRLLLEAKECEEDLPNTLIDKTLQDLGLMRTSAADEIKRTMEQTDRLAREQEAERAQQEQAQAVPAQAEPEPPPPPIVVQTEAAEPSRQPMNQTTGLPPDPHQTLQQAIAARRVQPAAANVEVYKRTSTIAALEADASGLGDDQIGTLPGKNGEPIPVVTMGATTEVVELRKQSSFDPSAAQQILDTPPAAGINPRFRPPQRA